MTTDSENVKPGGAKPKKEPQSARLVGLACDGNTSLWHTPEQVPYATVLVKAHRENLALRSRDFRRWLGRLLRSLVDPSVTPLRSEPREVRDLMIAATSGWVVALDNLSRLPQWLSDSLCRLSTGGGFATRELYTDSDEVLFDAQRPALL